MSVMRPAIALFRVLGVLAALAVLPLLYATFTVFHGELLGFVGAWSLLLGGLGASVLTLRVLWPFPRDPRSEGVKQEAQRASRVDAVVLSALFSWALVRLSRLGTDDLATQAILIVAACVAVMLVPLFLRSWLRRDHA
jgi:hypothetical protein